MESGWVMIKKTALITGAGSGIGRETAIYFAQKGYTVFAMGRSQPRLNETAALIGKAGRITPLCADATQIVALSDALRSLSRVDVLVVNAGICKQSAVHAPEADAVWHQVINTNLTGSWNTVHVTNDLLQKGGKVVLVSSGLGKLGRAEYTAYAASKHGLPGMMKCLALEWAHRKINVNAVCPGWVDTRMAQSDLQKSAVENHTSLNAERIRPTKSIPIGRFVTAKEVAALTGWLCSNNACAITGQAFNISGGEFGL